MSERPTTTASDSGAREPFAVTDVRGRAPGGRGSETLANWQDVDTERAP